MSRATHCRDCGVGILHRGTTAKRCKLCADIARVTRHRNWYIATRQGNAEWAEKNKIRAKAWREKQKQAANGKSQQAIGELPRGDRATALR